MQFPNCSKSKTRTLSGTFFKKMPPLTLLARASELEELL